MTRIVVDTAMWDKLHNFLQPVDLCDETERALARLMPVCNQADYGPLEPQVGEEELRRREQSDKWYSTEQVLAHLKKMEQP